jgi:hypothetical protein
MAMNSFLFLESDVVPDPGLGPRRGFVVVSGLFLEVVNSFGGRLLGCSFLFDTSNLSICALQKIQTSRPEASCGRLFGTTALIKAKIWKSGPSSRPIWA